MKQLPFHILAILIVAVWGVTFVSTKELILSGLGPVQIYLLRFSIAYLGILLTQCLLGKTKLWSRNVKDEIIMVLLGITGGSAYFLAENTALEYTQACNVSFIVCTAPLWTLILTILIRKYSKGRISAGQETVRIRLSLVFGIILTLFGMVAVVFDSVNKLHISPAGDLLSFAAALSWAVYTVLMGPVAKEYNALFITRKVFFYGLVTMIPILLLDRESCAFPPEETLFSPVVLWNILFLGIMASLLCFLGWNLVIARIGNVSSTNYVYLNPFFTLVFAIIFLGEHLSLLSLLGSIAIVSGVALASRKPSLQSPHIVQRKALEKKD